MTGFKPYNRLLDKQICVIFIKGHFLDLEPLPIFRDVIANYWKQSYKSTDKVLQDIKSKGIA
jgi:hypothetical protein